MSTMQTRSFPAFSLSRLLRCVFAPKPGERIAVLIDLPDPTQARNMAFLKDPSLTIQRHAYEVFHLGLQEGVLQELGLVGGELYAYRITGGSNLDLPDQVFDGSGRKLSFERDIYPKHNILLCLSTFSATAPLTVFARRFGFRGATLHGVNDIILASGLAVDYEDVSRQAEKLRLRLTRADAFEIEFRVDGRSHTLRLETGRQEAQKSHGLCRGEKPDIANLPAGEVYFVPTGADGEFPMRYEDGTLGLMQVAGGRIHEASLLRGRQEVIDAHNAKLQADPVTGELGELGFGTQDLPVSGQDIQDEKILGTLHVATGRSDHLGGSLTPDRFARAENATHDDILFSPTKTPEIQIPQVWMERDGQRILVLEEFQPAAHLREASAR
jgi:aminopeptidase